MRRPFRFLRHTTDVEFISSGATLAKAFEAAGLATFSAMTDLRAVRPDRPAKFSLRQRTDRESLLYDFLDRLIYICETKRMFFSRFRVRISGARLSAELKGEKISDSHPRRALVKAATYHGMRIWRSRGKWRCRALLDI